MVGCGGELFGEGTGNADVEFGVELARVARDDFGVQLAGKPDGEGGFAGCSGAEYEFKGFDDCRCLSCRR